ncbi:hypothetical protein BIW11_04560 [Tropilaelaps mercedesae]|uniref:Uncharacterized protein n=1 Tax=Tropilaelaps mercedesae TaxID=418985 RepID=A0A1V9X4J9_9ACAR|nr:hypothetical protein BIW11_04560 [Tropilaelaps mercedesae]
MALLHIDNRRTWWKHVTVLAFNSYYSPMCSRGFVLNVPQTNGHVYLYVMFQHVLKFEIPQHAPEDWLPVTPGGMPGRHPWRFGTGNACPQNLPENKIKY